MTLLISGLIYPIFAHWVWNCAENSELTGWLGRRHFVDFAGSTVVHSVGGWIGLAAILIIGPRQGRYPPTGGVKDVPRLKFAFSHGRSITACEGMDWV